MKANSYISQTTPHKDLQALSIRSDDGGAPLLLSSPPWRPSSRGAHGEQTRRLPPPASPRFPPESCACERSPDLS